MRLIIALCAAAALAGCTEYYSVPPNAIGMVLTPTGYDGQVLSPGQVNLGTVASNGASNTLVLIERSGVGTVERFIGPTNEDREDHRCLTADNAPVSIDVRMLLALPNVETSQGKKDFQRLLLLGRPAVDKNSRRTMWITADGVYADQARQQARGNIRQVCAAHKNFDAMFKAFATTGPDNLTTKIEQAIAGALQKAGVPLSLVNANVSNLKPDITVTQAIAAQQAAEKRTAAIRTVTDFLAEDTTGGRREIYRLQVWQEIVAIGNANGHNTIFMTEVGNGTGALVPMPARPK